MPAGGVRVLVGPPVFKLCFCCSGPFVGVCDLDVLGATARHRPQWCARVAVAVAVGGQEHPGELSRTTQGDSVRGRRRHQRAHRDGSTPPWVPSGPRSSCHSGRRRPGQHLHLRSLRPRGVLPGVMHRTGLVSVRTVRPPGIGSDRSVRRRRSHHRPTQRHQRCRRHLAWGDPNRDGGSQAKRPRGPSIPGAIARTGPPVVQPGLRGRWAVPCGAG
jgi:hypothetical protein